MFHETARKNRVLVIIRDHWSSFVVIFRPFGWGRPVVTPANAGIQTGLDSRVRGNNAQSQAAQIIEV
jgi:hypothetical protein